MRALTGRAMAFAIGLAGCYGPSATTGAPCGPGGECPTGQQCDRSVVPPACSTTIADARPADAPPDAPPPCATAADCDPAAPFCDPATSTCRGCQADAECGDDVCIEHLGTCTNSANTLFVAPTGMDTGSCTKAAPCASVDYALGVAANNQKVIAIADGIYSAPVSFQAFTPSSITLSGPDRDPFGVALAGGVVVDNSGQQVVVEGVTVTSSGRGIENRGTLMLSRVSIEGCGGPGLFSTNTGMLQIRDSSITNNTGLGLDISQTTLETLRTVIVGNTGGGVNINNAATTIESSIISENGGLFTIVGGVRYQNLNAKPQVFAFNTVANNAGSSLSPAVVCSTAVVLDSSIFADSSGTNPVGAGCEPIYSLFTGTPPAGTGNIMGDPQFVGAGDYHVMPGSPAVDAANPAATSTHDVDGDSRPQGMARDIGADELRVP